MKQIPPIDLSSTRESLTEFLLNTTIWTSLAGFAVAQFAKLFTHRWVHGKWVWQRIVGSGGMPSSHSALVMALTTTIGLQNGFSNDLFAACFMFSVVVMYDASGVRLQAGRQASVLNSIIMDYPPEHPVSLTGPTLRDTLGHTKLQVLVGAILGVITGLVSYAIFS